MMWLVLVALSVVLYAGLTISRRMEERAIRQREETRRIIARYTRVDDVERAA